MVMGYTGSYLLVLFNIFVGDMNSCIVCTLSTFVNDTKLSSMVTCWREEVPSRGTQIGLSGGLMTAS